MTIKIEDVSFEIRCEPEDLQIRGNCLASGDDRIDEECAVEIERQLKAGNDWAWCMVTVIGRWEGLEARDHLGGCSYKSEEDFCEPGGYLDQMKGEVLEDLKLRARNIGRALNKKKDHVIAEVHAGAWKLPKNDIWNVPTDTNEVRFDITTTGHGWNLITKIVGLAKTLDGRIFGMRSLSHPKESGYQLEGRVSIGGTKYRAFTSSQLFEREDGSLCDVGVLIVCGYKPVGVEVDQDWNDVAGAVR